MKDNPGMLLYKCRQCGQVHENGVHVPSIWRALNGLCDREPMMAYTATHKCSDGRIGFSDLCGGKPDKADE